MEQVILNVGVVFPERTSFVCIINEYLDNIHI
jgi:hypothetical protein